MNDKGNSLIQSLPGELKVTDYKTIGCVNSMLWNSVEEHPQREEFFKRYKSTINPTEKLFSDFLPFRFKVKKTMNQLGIFTFVRKNILGKK